MTGWRRGLRALWLQLVRIRTRLLVINLVAVLVPVVGLAWARTYEAEMLAALERDMRHMAEVVRTILERQQGAGETVEQRMRQMARALPVAARRTRMRLRLLDRAGAVVADSHRVGPPEGPEPAVSAWLGAASPPRRHHRPGEPGATDPGDISGRVEIAAARRGELGTATRVHERIGRVYLFLAMPVMVERRVRGVVYVTRSTTEVLLSLHRLRQALFQLLAVALGMTVLMSLFLATTISRPLGRLTRAASRVAHGERQVQLASRRSDEIGQLARAFDAMVQQLQARASYISEFAANISHEFKTPLTSIRGAAELLADGAMDDHGARQRFLGNILEDSARLDRLVSRILELSRIEAEPERTEAVDLAQVTRAAAEEGHPDGAVQLVLEPAQGELEVRGNPGHLLSAVRALVENAVQVSSDGQPVRVELRAVGSEAHLRVIDQGPGISAANQRRIFDRFFTTRGEQGGTGLGLSIVASVVRAHGGRVWVHSEPGRGTRFEVALPLWVRDRGSSG